MEDEFVTYNIAVKLHGKGFDEHCINAINSHKLTYRNGWCEYLDDRDGEYITQKDLKEGNYLLPTVNQVLKWLRKVKKIFITINIGYCYENEDVPFYKNQEMNPILKGFYYGIWLLNDLNDKQGHSEYFDSPEDAEIAAIEYVLSNML